MAQGLHDSIAQGLNYLNLEAQLLEDAVSRGVLADVAAIVPMLRCGVDESYQDVRELLLNFRHPGSRRASCGRRPKTPRRAAASALPRCGWRWRATTTPGRLPFDAQLQVLFVLQEVLSNVRKHAQAGHVLVRLQGGRDLELVVQDDGEGFDAAADSPLRSEMQVACTSCAKRRVRLNAQLSIDSAPGRGHLGVALRVPCTWVWPARPLKPTMSEAQRPASLQP